MLRMPFQDRESKIVPVGRTELYGERIYIRPPHINDYEQWAVLRGRSEAFLKPWEPVWPNNALSLGHYRGLLQSYHNGRVEQSCLVFFIFDKQNHFLIGGISLGNIRKGVVQSGQIGYWCGHSFAGRGYMREGLELLTAYAFSHLKLHRLEAAVIPSNQRSLGLLERCGFTQEGLLRSYVKINGKWEDHLLYSLLETDVAQHQTGVIGMVSEEHLK